MSRGLMRISNTTLTDTAGTLIARTPSGGNGNGSAKLSVTGTRCKTSKANLIAFIATTCSVVATQKGPTRAAAVLPAQVTAHLHHSQSLCSLGKAPRSPTQVSRPKSTGCQFQVGLVSVHLVVRSPALVALSELARSLPFQHQRARDV